MLTRDRDSAISCHPMPFLQELNMFTPRLVSFHHGLSRAVTCSFYAVIFTRLRSCRLCCRSDLWTGLCRDLHPIKWGWSAIDLGCWVCKSHPPLKLTLGTQTLSPKPILCPCNVQNDTPTTSPCKHERETGTGQARNTWGTRTSWGEVLEGQNFHGGSRSFLVTRTSLGVTRRLFGLYRLQNAS